MNRLVNLILKENVIYLTYENAKYFIKVISNDIVQIAQIEALDYKSYAVENDISEDVEIKIEDNVILFSNKNGFSLSLQGLKNISIYADKGRSNGCKTYRKPLSAFETSALGPVPGCTQGKDTSEGKQCHKSCGCGRCRGVRSGGR